MARTKRIITTQQLRSSVIGSWRRVERNLKAVEDPQGSNCKVQHELPRVLQVFQPIINLLAAYKALTKQQLEDMDLKAMKKQVVDTWGLVRKNGRTIKYSWTCQYTSLKDVLEPFEDMVEPLKREVYPDAFQLQDRGVTRALVDAYIELWQKVGPVAQERLMRECGLDADTANKILMHFSRHVSGLQYDIKKFKNVAVNADSIIVHTWNTYASRVNISKAADMYHAVKVPEACLPVLADALEPIREFANRIYHSEWDDEPMWNRPQEADVHSIIAPKQSPRASPVRQTLSPRQSPRKSPPKPQMPSSSPSTRQTSPPKPQRPSSSPSTRQTSPPKLQRPSSSPSTRQTSPPKLQRSPTRQTSPPKLQRSPTRQTSPPKPQRPSPCPDGKVVNPLTKKCIDPNGALARLLRRVRIIK